MFKKLNTLFTINLVLMTACSPAAVRQTTQPTNATITKPPVPVASGVENIPAKYRGRLKLFVLMGQSNMSGRGEVPEELKHTNPQVYLFGNDYQWKLAEEPVDSAEGQVDMVSEDGDAGISPSLGFAETLLGTKPEWAIGLIPCAKNSTSLLDWEPDDDPKTLYGSCWRRIMQAAQMGTVEGILFYQGETDAIDPDYYDKLNIERNILPAEQWAEKFGEFVAAWRRDLGIPDLPVVFAQIATTATDEEALNWDLIKEQQASVDLPYVRMITTEDLELGDAVHLTAESYLEVGRRFAEAYLEIIQ